MKTPSRLTGFCFYLMAFPDHFHVKNALKGGKRGKLVVLWGYTIKWPFGSVLIGSRWAHVWSLSIEPVVLDFGLEVKSNFMS